MRSSRFASLAVGLAASACVDNDISLQISTIKEASPQEDPLSCEVDSGNQDLLGGGVVDAVPYLFSALPGYLVHPVIRNNLISSLQQGHPNERNTVFLRRFEVDLDYGLNPGENGYDPNVAALLQGNVGYRLDAEGAISPGGSALVVGVEVVPSDLIGIIGAIAYDDDDPEIPRIASQPIVATLRVVAEHGGQEIESNDFTVGVSVCYDCLVQGVFPPVLCDDLEADEDVASRLTAGNDCGNLPQDASVDCCWREPSRGGDPVLECPARAALATGS